MELSYILVFFGVISIIYWFLTKNYDYWEKQNVPFLANPVPGFGNVLSLVTLRESIYSFNERVYKSSTASMVGFYFMRKPSLLIRDPEVIKNIVQTNFPSFRSNFMRLNEKQDPILSKHPFFTNDLALWKNRRNHVSNNLTGKKLSHLLVIAQEVCSKTNKFIDRKIDENGGFYECELKQNFVKYTGEIVANAAFGVEGQSFEDNPDRLSFAKVAGDLFVPSFLNGIKQSVLFYLPEIGEFFNMGFIEKRAEVYFRENIKKIIELRRQENVSPNDYLQFCLDSNSENNMNSTIADLVMFYGDVYETSGSALSHLFFHLSMHREIQETLRQHIISKLDGKPASYENLKEMTYLEQVINESMRLSPPVGDLLKVCTDEITISGPDGITCHMKPGFPVFIPTMNIQLDEKYWPNPEKFDPERFSPENQHSITKYTFMPFGEGPRMCIGMRLAMMIIKISAISILTRYSIEPSKKMKFPLEVDPFAVVIQYKGGSWAKFVKLTEKS